MTNHLFESFNNGSLKLPAATVEFTNIPWTRHPDFEGVELKHIVTARDTDGGFSYHSFLRTARMPAPSPLK